MADLALTRTTQGGRLNVRQRESLRRALIEAGTALLWNEMALRGENSLDVIADDLAKLTKSGVRVIEREIEDELKMKRSELKQLQKVADQARKVAEAKDPKLPTEITYLHTARAAAQGLITKEVVVEVTTKDEAQSCADGIEKSLGRWENLRDQMVDELKKKNAQLSTLNDSIADFVQAQRSLIREVVAILH